jgi:hypothetical protein
VSDASGQLEAKHTINTGEAKTFLRVNEILQFQVRSKLIDRLVQWKEDLPSKRFFAFTHLFLNLKDRGVTERLPAEIIPEVARIRTDLDQFSYIERDSLMYHGYTLIDAQIKKYCLPLTTAYSISNTPQMTVPPLYNPGTLDTTEKRDRIRKELEAGAQKIFLLRSFKKYPRTVGLMLTGWIAVWGYTLYLLFGLFTKPLELIQLLIMNLLSGITSGWIGTAIDWLLFYAKLPIRTSMIDGTARLLSAGVLIAVAGYVLAFPTYWFVHRLVMRADRKSYHHLTGTTPTTCWRPLSKEEKASQSVNS